MTSIISILNVATVAYEVNQIFNQRAPQLTSLQVDCDALWLKILVHFIRRTNVYCDEYQGMIYRKEEENNHKLLILLIHYSFVHYYRRYFKKSNYNLSKFIFHRRSAKL